LSGNSPKNFAPVAGKHCIIHHLANYFPMQPNSLLSFQHLHLDLFEAGITCIVLFAIGYWLGALKSRKLIRKMGKMEKKIMDLNTELLYGPRTADHS